MNSSIIVLDSSDDEADSIKKPPPIAPPSKHFAPPSVSPKPNTVITKRPLPETPLEKPATTIKRLKPTLLTKTVDKTLWTCDDSILLDSEPIEIPDSQPSKDIINSPSSSSGISEKRDDASETTAAAATPPTVERAPLEPDYEKLIEACRTADPSPDMERLIEIKLINYYYSVHPDFVKSKNFRKTVRSVTEEIRKEPAYVYAKVKTVVDELKVRKKSKAIVMSNEDVTTTGDAKKDAQIKKLNKALYILKRRITKLEQDEVDWNDDDEDTTYLQVERFKKRACEIYEKICDLTGESKHAHRSTKKPISFNGTSYPQFNRTVQAFVNRTNCFPDFVDVLSCLEYCNKQYSLDLLTEEMRKIAHDAFIKIGKLLQNRRKTDLYETVSHFTLDSADPAESDATLSAKLNENMKHHKNISSIIDKFAREQDVAADNLKKQRLAENEDTPENASEENVNDNHQNSTADLEPVNNNNKEDGHTNNNKLEDPAPELNKTNGRLLPSADLLKISTVASLNCKQLPKELFNEPTPSIGSRQESSDSHHSKGSSNRVEIIISDEEDS